MVVLHLEFKESCLLYGRCSTFSKCFFFLVPRTLSPTSLARTETYPELPLCGKIPSMRAEAVKSPKVMNVAKWIPKSLQIRNCTELAPIVDTNAEALVAGALPET